MRKISRQAAEAFFAGRPFKKDNTVVEVCDTGVVVLKLWGNQIASSSPRAPISPVIRFTLCGWDTVTTRDRLNALGISIYKRNGQLYWFYDNRELAINDTGAFYIDWQKAKDIAGIGGRIPARVWPNRDLRKE